MIKIKGLTLYLREKYIFSFLLVSVIAIALSIVLILLKMVQPGIVPLHYDIFFGIDKIGPWYNILLAPAAGLFVLLINNTIAYFIFSKSKYISYFLTFVAAISNIVILLHIATLSSFAF